MHILVILTDMTSFAEAMREVSSSKGEIPMPEKDIQDICTVSLQPLYERAGIVRGADGSVTQLTDLN